MNLTTITFSPTGGTDKCCKTLSEAIGSITESIDLTRRNLSPVSLTDNDVAVIAVPSFSGRVPKLALERLSNINGNGARAILMAVYGNRAYEDTLIELRDGVVKLGFKVIAAVSAVAKHSVATTIASDRPDESDMDTLKKIGAEIKSKIERNESTEPAIPGNRPYRKTGPGIVPNTKKSKCNGCGVCARQCPSGAIDADNPGKIDKNACISCMRCVAVCPTGAKRISPLMLALVSKMLKKPCSTRKEIEIFI